MRAVIQRVKKANVSVSEKTVGQMKDKQDRKNLVRPSVEPDFPQRVLRTENSNSKSTLGQNDDHDQLQMLFHSRADTSSSVQIVDRESSSLQMIGRQTAE